MELRSNMTEGIEGKSLAEMKLQELKRLFPEFFFDDQLDVNGLQSFLGELSPDVINDSGYGLNWLGKADAIRILRKQSEGSLSPLHAQSLSFDNAENIIVKGDNLEVMKLIQKSYFGSFKMIYMDPPYNAGDEFIFDDDVDNPLLHYFEVVKQLQRGEYATTGQRRHSHSRWITMMLPRLFMARNLLSADGVIFVSIDDHESHYLRIIMDEVFGPENFVCSFVWEKRYAPAPDAQDVAYVHENILCYKRSDTFHAGLLLMTDEQTGRYTNPDSDPRGPWKAADYTCRYSATERPTLYYPIINPNTGEEVYPKKTRVWACSKKEHETNVKEKLIWWPPTAKGPAKKAFLSEIKQGGMPKTILNYTVVGHTDEATKELRNWFPAIKVPSKPSKLLQHLIRIANLKTGDLVLDCFAGTGTMAEAVLNLNKTENLGLRFILIQFPEPLKDDSSRDMADLAIKRAEDCAKALYSESAPGIRCFNLSDSCFNSPSFKKPKDEQELINQLSIYTNNVREGKSNEEVLFAIMLKYGFKLDEKICSCQAINVPYYSLMNGQFLICLDNHLSDQFFAEIVNQRPRQVVCLDTAFNGDDQLKTNAMLVLQNQGIRFSTI